MKKTYLAAAIAATFAIQGTAFAQDYQMEAGLSYIDFDSDTAIGLDFTYFLETVNTADRPLSEAYFLGRNNNLSASYVTFDEADVDGFGLGGEFWFDDIYAAASLSDVDGEQDFSARVGYMFSDNFLLNGGLADGDSYADPSVLVGAKYVAKLGENFVNLEADLDLNDDNTLMLVGDYFFTNEFSAGVRVTESDADGADTVFGVGARYFFTPVISGEVEYKTADSEDAYGLRVAARF